MFLANKSPVIDHWSPIIQWSPIDQWSPYAISIPDKIRNASRRTDQLSGRSKMMGQFRLYRCKGVSGAITYHLQPGVKNVYKKTGQKPSTGQIVKLHKISVFIMLPCWISPSNRNLLSRPQMVLRHLFFATSIFNIIIRDY